MTLSCLPIMMNPAMETFPIMTLDPEALRSAMRAWTAGVTIVSAAYAGIQHGMTVNSFTSISLDPAWVTISLQQSTRTHGLIRKAGAFGITILSTEQRHLSERFAGHAPRQPHPEPAEVSSQEERDDRFAGLEIETLVTGSPLIKGGLAYLDCRLVQTIPAGMNTLFIGEVLAARGRDQGQPLIYHNRKYWRLSDL